MDFFNKLTKKAKETYEGASKKTSELAKEAKLKMKMNENKSEISDLYEEIGKKVYEKHTRLEPIDIQAELEEECTKIDILSAEIESCLNQIRELKNKKQCPKCFNEIELDANFCNHCGAKQNEEEAREVEVVEVQNVEEQPQEDVTQNTASTEAIEVPVNNEVISEEVEVTNKPEATTENDDTINNEN